jgi:hypothetical protein
MEVEEGYFGARSPARIGTKLCFLLQELRDLACFCSEMKMKHAHGVQGVEYDWGGGDVGCCGGGGARPAPPWQPGSEGDVAAGGEVGHRPWVVSKSQGREANVKGS